MSAWYSGWATLGRGCPRLSAGCKAKTTPGHRWRFCVRQPHTCSHTHMHLTTTSWRCSQLLACRIQGSQRVHIHNAMAFYNLLQLGRADLVLAGIGSVFVALPLFSLHRVTRATSGQLDRLGLGEEKIAASTVRWLKRWQIPLGGAAAVMVREPCVESQNPTWDRYFIAIVIELGFPHPNCGRCKDCSDLRSTFYLSHRSTRVSPDCPID